MGDLSHSEYTGEKVLAQYKIHDTFMETREEAGVQQVRVKITLERQLFGVLLNVIIPTIVLGLISYSTNFYKDEYFESVIAINLTTMLVIVTLFVRVSTFKTKYPVIIFNKTQNVQVGENLPATSYIKMIDVWLLFNLIIPFALIILHTYMDFIRRYMEYNVT